MTVEQTISHISSLPTEDQLRVVHAIWDRLAETVGTELTDTQKDELDRRWERYLANPDMAISEEDFRNQVREARQ